jgi:acetylornithine/N-succinyldiaminopimelate aminotransferase
MLEPIQGEGGINVADTAYLHGLKKLCAAKDLLLIFDEVQTAMGRTGEYFCFKNYGVQPDIMTLAKSLGSGVPIGAVVASRRICDILGPGSHATTFGGSPLVCAAALATFESIESGKLLFNVNRTGKYMFAKLERLKKKYPDIIKEIRGLGIMAGVELYIEGDEIVKACKDRGLLINCTQKNVLRIMPPLTVKRGHVSRAVRIIDAVLSRIGK